MQRLVLVTNRSSPTSCTEPPSVSVSMLQPSQSSSSSGSSSEAMGYWLQSFFQWAVSEAESYSFPLFGSR